MKKLLLLVLATGLLSASLFAKSVPGFSYQAVARGASGEVIANQMVGIEIGILQGSFDGELLYTEEFFPTTNAYGLMNLTIGTGMATSGSFSDIDWSYGSYFVKVSMDETGGTNFEKIAVSQLLSVPYAMYAKTAETVLDLDVNDADSDPDNEIQQLSLEDNVLRLSSSDVAVVIPDNTEEIAKLEAEVSAMSVRLKSIAVEMMGSGTFIDERDEQIYKWVKTDDGKTWMGDNLRANVYTDSTVITGALDYDGDPVVSEEYGKLYTFDAIQEAGKSICPDGYRMSTCEEWQALFMEYGGEAFAAEALKESGTDHWNAAGSVSGKAETLILPAGIVGGDGSSAMLGQRAYMWTGETCAGNPGYGVAYQFSAEHNIVVKVNMKKDVGLSIRCVKED